MFTVVVQGVLTPLELRGSFGKNELVINDGIFQAIGVISFGMWLMWSSHIPQFSFCNAMLTKRSSVRLPPQLAPNIRLPREADH